MLLVFSVSVYLNCLLEKFLNLLVRLSIRLFLMFLMQKMLNCLQLLPALLLPWQCLMCQASNHLFNDCPKVLDLDFNTRCVVFSSLLRARGPSQPQIRPSTNSCSLQIQRVHAVTADDTSTPFDESALDFASSTDDSNILEETKSHLDFQ